MQPNRQEAETNPQADRIFTTESTEIHGKRIELPVASEERTGAGPTRSGETRLCPLTYRQFAVGLHLLFRAPQCGPWFNPDGVSSARWRNDGEVLWSELS